ncbi:Flp pilus assembly protein CpaB [Rhodopseudomonas palustris]|uniref:Flp pilus assembly protein CpaB n=1 Tax=Rhodopseudomonas palustris TaxID=1076 RepID=UPI0022F0FB16|nr:Flp pilus assembly protein CpaB [Rhodopseudomonas palustris]WBU29231.1 Flp pilus assembly protein CpaB [Rhodopseudomonas palustris]
MRLSKPRIVVLGIALAAGAAAAFLASSSDSERPRQVAEPAPQLQTVDVLVAKSNIALGQLVTPSDVRWQSWPADSASEHFLRRDKMPNTEAFLAGTIARSPFVAGEPIREVKLVKPNGSGFMAAILPTGMRAVSTEISPETSAGGFILPNDKVDVILTKRDKSSDIPGAKDTVTSTTILTNVRVLAIDQLPKEREGQNVVVGKTATLELKGDQAEVLTRARQSGTLSLALRSIADARIVAEASDQGDKQITVYRGTDKELYSCAPLCERR